MKTFLAALALAAVAFLPASAMAQNYEDIIAHHSYDPTAKNQKPNAEQNAASIYGDTLNETEALGGGDTTGAEETGDDSQQSYDQQAMGGDTPQDIYSYVAGQSKMSATERRERDAKKANDAALKTRAATLKKMQRSSEQLLKQQKERAWKLAHPGQEYKGEEGEEGDDAEETSYSSGDDDQQDDDQDQSDGNQDEESQDGTGSNGGY